MDRLVHLIDAIMHLDRALQGIFQQYGAWTYGVLFLIVFCETGLVVAPLLPGDSLLFAAGALAAGGSLDVSWLMLLLSIAAIVGDTVNYQIGYALGPKVLSREDGRFLKKAYLERTRRFFDKYGGKTIFLARFVPIVRTFAPFLAGVGSMTYWRFAGFNVAGGLVWVVAFILAGYYFGNLPVVKSNFTLVILAIIAISLVPVLLEFLRERRRPPVVAPGEPGEGAV